MSKKDDEFLKVILVECEKKLRWHSDIEYRLLNMFIVISPVIITAVIGIKQFIGDSDQYFYLTKSIAIFLLILTFFISLKVYFEHKTYRDVAEDVINIWKFFKLLEDGVYLPNQRILSKNAENYGKGIGWFATVLILWVITIVTSSILLIFGSLQL